MDEGAADFNLEKTSSNKGASTNMEKTGANKGASISMESTCAINLDKTGALVGATINLENTSADEGANVSMDSNSGKPEPATTKAVQQKDQDISNENKPNAISESSVAVGEAENNDGTKDNEDAEMGGGASNSAKPEPATTKTVQQKDQDISNKNKPNAIGESAMAVGEAANNDDKKDNEDAEIGGGASNSGKPEPATTKTVQQKDQDISNKDKPIAIGECAMALDEAENNDDTKDNEDAEMGDGAIKEETVGQILEPVKDRREVVEDLSADKKDDDAETTAPLDNVMVSFLDLRASPITHLCPQSVTSVFQSVR